MLKLSPFVVSLCLANFCVAAPLAYWEFEEDPGFVESSASPAVTLINDGNSVTKLAEGGPGAGQAAGFDGTARFTAPDAAGWSGPQLTIEAYFKVDAITGSGQVIVSHHNNTNSEKGWHMLVTSSGKLRFRKYGSNDSDPFVDMGTVEAGKNYYAAVLFDATSGALTMFLKDLSEGGVAEEGVYTFATGLRDADSLLAIGATGTSTGGTSFFKGEIDSVRISGSVLPEDELMEDLEIPVVVNSEKVNGYKGIWFALGQVSEFGDKYSGGLATYTVNHSPLAVYAPEVDKTFFTYGGTTAANEGHLLIMAGWYDHKTKTVPKPTIVMDKQAANGDPHDNASITVDEEGYVWVFVSGRNTSRKGYTFRSSVPYSTDAFERISPPGGEDYTYPQIWHVPGSGFAHFFTLYDGGKRNLYFRKSADGMVWSPTIDLAKVGGSYQVTGVSENGRLATFYNRHVNGNVNTRTDLYYLQSDDFGETWTLADGTPVSLPITERESPARVVDYASEGRLMYNCDLNFDADGNPVLFYLTTADYRPGPDGEPRTYHVAHWTGTEWKVHDLPASATPLSSSTHNYSAGSIWIEEGKWTILAPTGARSDLRDSDPERFWGHGGEIEHWVSTDEGASWTRTRKVTEKSERNHGYLRRSLRGAGRFQSFWSDGNPQGRTEVHLYFGEASGERQWELPYEMTEPTATPKEVNPPFKRWQDQSFNEIELADPDTIAADEDPDGDGFSNFREYLAGTDPGSALSHPPLAGLVGERSEEGFLLKYRVNREAFDVKTLVEACGNLSSWQDESGNLTEISRADAGLADLVTLRAAFSESEGRFYRLNQSFDR